MPKQTSADSTRRRERKRTIIEIATIAHREREASRAMLSREKEASRAMLRKAKEANVEIIDKTTIAVVTTETEVSADKANALKTTAHKVSVSKANVLKTIDLKASDLKATIALNLSKANKETNSRENKK